MARLPGARVTAQPRLAAERRAAAGRRPPSLGQPRRRQAGQGLVEFALVIPLFLTSLIGILEFGMLYSALNGINYASRDAALLAAELGNTDGGDCVIISQVESDVGAPADRQLIQSITIAWTDANGVTQTDGSGNPYSNVYTRGGSTTCSLPTGDVTVPYTRVTDNYPEADRCNILAGCPAPHDGGLDTIAVQVIYQYVYKTPLATLLNWTGSTGWTLDKSNAMRMEPIL